MPINVYKQIRDVHANGTGTFWSGISVRCNRAIAKPPDMDNINKTSVYMNTAFISININMSIYMNRDV